MGIVFDGLLWLGAAWSAHRFFDWLRRTYQGASATLGAVAAIVDIPLSALALQSARHYTGDGAALFSAVILAVSAAAWPIALAAGITLARRHGDSWWATALAFFPEALVWGTLAAPLTTQVVFRLG